MKRKSAPLFFLALAFCLAGCGYRAGMLIPPDVKTIHVRMFDNETFRHELEIPLTRAVKDEMARRTNLRFASPESADSVLSGAITRIRARATVYDQADEVLTQEIAVHVRFEWRRANGELIAGSPDVRGTAQRIAVRDATQTAAILDILPDLAENIVEEMQEGF